MKHFILLNGGVVSATVSFLCVKISANCTVGGVVSATVSFLCVEILASCMVLIKAVL